MGRGRIKVDVLNSWSPPGVLIRPSAIGKINSPFFFFLEISPLSHWVFSSRFPMRPSSPTPQGLRSVRHLSKFTRVWSVSEELCRWIFLQIDGFFTRLSQQKGNTQPVNPMEWAILWQVTQNVFHVESAHQITDLWHFEDRCNIPQNLPTNFHSNLINNTTNVHYTLRTDLSANPFVSDQVSVFTELLPQVSQCFRTVGRSRFCDVFVEIVFDRTAILSVSELQIAPIKCISVCCVFKRNFSTWVWLYPLCCQVLYHHGVSTTVSRFTFFTEHLMIRKCLNHHKSTLGTTVPMRFLQISQFRSLTKWVKIQIPLLLGALRVVHEETWNHLDNWNIFIFQVVLDFFFCTVVGWQCGWLRQLVSQENRNRKVLQNLRIQRKDQSMKLGVSSRMMRESACPNLVNNSGTMDGLSHSLTWSPTKRCHTPWSDLRHTDVLPLNCGHTRPSRSRSAESWGKATQIPQPVLNRSRHHSQLMKPTPLIPSVCVPWNPWTWSNHLTPLPQYFNAVGHPAPTEMMTLSKSSRIWSLSVNSSSASWSTTMQHNFSMISRAIPGSPSDTLTTDGQTNEGCRDAKCNKVRHDVRCVPKRLRQSTLRARWTSQTWSASCTLGKNGGSQELPWVIVLGRAKLWPCSMQRVSSHFLVVVIFIRVFFSFCWSMRQNFSHFLTHFLLSRSEGSVPVIEDASEHELEEPVNRPTTTIGAQFYAMTRCLWGCCAKWMFKANKNETRKGRMELKCPPLVNAKCHQITSWGCTCFAKKKRCMRMVTCCKESEWSLVTSLIRLSCWP